MTEEQEKAKLIKDALKIVDELGKLYYESTNEQDAEILIGKAYKLTKSRHWKLT